jgi:GT2 family glycosyltransferase
VPKRILDEIGSFDDRLKSGGDSDLGRRIRRAGHRIVYAPDSIVRHPARRTYREILRKSVRIAGGLFQRADSSAHYGASQAIAESRANRLFIRETQIILRIYRDPEHGGLTNTLRVLFVASLVVTARHLEFMRLRMGYEPRRA